MGQDHSAILASCFGAYLVLGRREEGAVILRQLSWDGEFMMAIARWIGSWVSGPVGGMDRMESQGGSRQKRKKEKELG